MLYNYSNHKGGGEMIFVLAERITVPTKLNSATEKEEKNRYFVGNKEFLAHFIFISGKPFFNIET